MQDYKPIKTWADDDKPREKLISKGIKSLSDSELLAILIGSGYKNNSAVDLAKEILQMHNNSFMELAKISLEDLQKFKGIGQAKAITILATMEIGRRTKNSQNNTENIVTSPEDVFEYMHKWIADLQHEEFWVLYLNNKNKILRHEKISQGGLTETSVDIRIIMKQALSLFAINFIICHNHPSNICTPSKEDIKITEKIKKAAELLDIKLLDHIIITSNDFYSFSKNNLI